MKDGRCPADGILKADSIMTRRMDRVLMKSIAVDGRIKAGRS